MFYMFLCLYKATPIFGHYLHKLDKFISLFSSFYLLKLISDENKMAVMWARSWERYNNI